MNFKKLILIIVVIAIIGSLIAIMLFSNGVKNQVSTDKLSIVVTTFSAYDFVRQIASDHVEITYLLGPGVDVHSYEPTSQDLIKIQNSDIFIYIGGEMEEWTKKVLDSLDTKDTKLICLADTVTTIEEQEVDGAEEEIHAHEEEEEHGHQEEHAHSEGAFDEHIWTSPTNAMIMVQSLANELSAIDKEHEHIYQKNAQSYIAEIRNVQLQIQKIVDSKVRDRLIFADKMPMQYFINEFKLKVSAAFHGCSTETEPSSSTIAYLIEKVKEENIPVILYIELNNGKVAKTIAEETGIETMQIQTLHNISKDDFQNGETYVSLMARNLEVLKKALQ